MGKTALITGASRGIGRATAELLARQGFAVAINYVQSQRAAEELAIPEEKAVLLQHMILSHHGQPEFGAAVVPMCAESELLSLIDTMDSRMEIYRETLAETPEGTFSKRIFALEKRIYHPTEERR